MSRWTQNRWLWIAGVALICGAIALALCALQGCDGQARAETVKNFAACDAEAKSIARTAPACSVAIDRLLELMHRPECADFASAPQGDRGITIGGVTYVCDSEVPSGR